MVNKKLKQLPGSRKEQRLTNNWGGDNSRTFYTNRNPEFHARQGARTRQIGTDSDYQQRQKQRYDQEQIAHETRRRIWLEQQRNLEGQGSLAQVEQQLGNLSVQPRNEQRVAEAASLESDGISAKPLEPKDSRSLKGGNATNRSSNVVGRGQDHEGINHDDKVNKEDGREEEVVDTTETDRWYKYAFRTAWLDHLPWPPDPPPLSNPGPYSPVVSFPTIGGFCHRSPAPSSRIGTRKSSEYVIASRGPMNRAAATPRVMPSSSIKEPHPMTAAQSKEQEDTTMREIGERLARTRLGRYETPQSNGVRKATHRPRRKGDHHCHSRVLPREQAARENK